MYLTPMRRWFMPALPSYVTQKKKKKKKLTKDFSNICDWFVENKLSTHFGEDKTKPFYLVPNVI